MRDPKTYFATKAQAHSRSKVSRSSRWPEDAEQDEATPSVIEVSLGRGLSVLVQVQLEEIRQVAPAEVWLDLVDADDEILASSSVELGANDDTAPSFRVRADPRVVRKHTVWGVLLSLYETVHLRWQVQVVDRSGRVLGRRSVEYEMHGA
ncbi:hypothetical protein [Polyangium jinanense]|uniref:Uncharacterized protein n=1 Tax=Polyangium jinanense TaxID=2829994 RepID=A0A9X4AY71_9BACT|nr:hypothetical protein [Polyangium jinanense]MDC3959016.1 hypothetical protein [Polyangium jinanense]MDC3988491.1 hypothetical protein [Polyangium jinanense]